MLPALHRTPPPPPLLPPPYRAVMRGDLRAANAGSMIVLEKV
jgi:hypothetical protein